MNTSGPLRLRASLLMQQGRHELAEEQLRLALAQDSADATSHAMLAICLTEREAWEPATEEARQAIASAPDDGYAHFAMAYVMRSRNRLTEARAAIREALRLDPADADYHGMLASIEANAEQWKDCLAAAETGLQFDAEHDACGNLRAMALTKLGRRAEAGVTINESLRRDPENAFTHANEGWRLLHAREPQKAMEHFREALRLEPDMQFARSGIIEAMKARFFVYRWMLSFFLWVGRFPPRVQLAIVVGFPLLNSMVQRTLAAIPALSWLSGPLVIAWLLFVWLSWSSSSLTELVLLCSRFGRLALNQREKLRASLTGLCVVLAVCVSAVHWVISYHLPRFWELGLEHAVLFLALTIPVQGIFLANGSSGKRLAILVAAAVTAAVVWSNVKLFQLRPLFEEYAAASSALQQKIGAADAAQLRSVKPDIETMEQLARDEEDEDNPAEVWRKADPNGERSEDEEVRRNTALQVLSGIAQAETSRTMEALKQLSDGMTASANAWQIAIWAIVISSWIGLGLHRAPVRH